MGWGDEIIASGQARVIHERKPNKVVIYDRHGAQRYHEIWEGNPRIADRSFRLTGAYNILRNGPGMRPYIAEKTPTRWVWRDWECPRGEIYLTHAEKAYAHGYGVDLLIEPNNKAKASPNKDWGIGRWTELAALAGKAGLRVAQMGTSGVRVLPGVRIIPTGGFRLACAVLARAKIAVLPEGGLHHAAAALDVPSIVLFGGYISPRQTGYEGQRSLFTGGEPCGMRVECEHCKRAMAAITPADVMREIEGLI